MGLFARTLHRLRRPSRDARVSGPPVGTPAVLDGASAVAIAEAAWSEVATSGAGYPSAASARAWAAEARTSGTNLLGRPLGELSADRGRAGLSTALGLAASGVRASVFLSSPDLLASLDLLAQAVGRGLPLVIHHTCRATSGGGAALGTGHDAHHAAADTGAVLLFARTVQEAIDLGLVARRVAETALVPVVISMDADPTATSVEDVLLPTRAMVEALVGAPDDVIAAPTPAQALLFGAERRRMPAFHDLDVPVLGGALTGPAVTGVAAASRRAFLAGDVLGILTEALHRVGPTTHRPTEPLARHRVDDADLVIVGEGAVGELAEAVADHLRDAHRVKAGVVTVRVRRPWPAEAIGASLDRRRRVVVIERSDPSLAGDGPLTRELRSFLDDTRLHPLIAGVGSAVHPRDLVAACREVAAGVSAGPRLLGIDPSAETARYPKRRVRAEAVLRAAPRLAAMALRAPHDADGHDPLDLRGPDTFTLAVHRTGAEDTPALAARAAALLAPVLGPRVRTRLAHAAGPFDGGRIDLVTVGPAPLVDPGPEPPVDLAVIPASVARDAGPRDGLPTPRALLVLSNHDLDREGPFVTGLRRREVPILVTGAPDEAGLLGAIVAAARTLGMSLPATRVRRAFADLLDPEGERDGDDPTAAFTAGEEGVRPLELAPETDPDASAADDGSPAEVPLAVRHLTRGDDAHDSLPRFWDRVGVLYRDGREGALTPDPALAIGTVPPLSAVLRDLTAASDLLPEFDPGPCTGCGACWTVCPEGAVTPLVVAPGPLLDRGMAAAKRAGHDVSALGMITAKLVQRMGRTMSGDDAPATAGDLLRASFDPLVTKMDPPEERRSALSAAIDAVIDAVGPLPLAATPPFHEALEVNGAGTGELVSIAIDPAACKACGLCTAACEPGALPRRPRDAATLATARTRMRIGEEIPDAPATTLTRVSEDERVGAAAATLLSRHVRSTFGGGDGSEAGSGDKVALRAVLAAIEVERQPVVTAQLAEIDGLRETLATTIRTLFADALPTDDLDALGAGLDALVEDDVDVGDLTVRIDRATAGGTVDAARLRRLVALAKSLTDLRWKLARGVNGFGRARTSLAIADGTVAAWAAAFPRNPFAIPVAVDAAGEAPGLARGLLQGHLRGALDDARLLRRARLELDRQTEAPHRSAELATLGWDGLTDEERRRVPPLLLVGDDRGLGGAAIGALAPILADHVPLLALVLGGGDLGLPGDAPSGDVGHGGGRSTIAPGLLALAHRTAFVLQSSVGALDHLTGGVRDALRTGRPALVHVHAPSPTRHGFAPDATLERARSAIRARVVPLFRYDPGRPGVFGSRLDLSANPAPDAATLEEDGAPLDPIGWARGETRYADEWADDAPSAALSRASEVRLAEWRTLQELAGVVTPFTEEVRASAERDVADAHAKELAAVRSEYEARLATEAEAVREEMATRLQERLLVLSNAGRETVPGGTP